VGRGNRASGRFFERYIGTGNRGVELIVVLIAALVFLLSVISPPALMDDVDSVQAQIARNMLTSGDWVTAHLDGVAYLEKSPLKYWMIAVSYMIFGIHDWAARLPIAFSAIALCWLTAHIGSWAFRKPDDKYAGFYSGLVLATCVGLFLFTRILIPDVILTLAITAALYGIVRSLDSEEQRPFRWAMLFWFSMAAGILLKGLIASLFPVAVAGIYLLVTGQLFRLETWKRLYIVPGMALFLALAAPWHVLATIRNPPYFDFTLHSESGSYRGFFWFYFFNEHILRFLNTRYPRDYNTVPRPLFWAFHLVWFFPWSAYLPAVAALNFLGEDRASRLRLLALCWIGFVLLFFTLSTTQEYYSMPCYPAFALLLGSAMAAPSKLLRPATKVLGVMAAALSALLLFLLLAARGLPTPGDISLALNSNPELYTLSMGHIADLTQQAFAYLRLPLALAAFATAIGAVGALAFRGRRAYLALAVMMILFFQAARIALIAFNPYLGSKPLADALVAAPPGELIVDDQYYSFSSVFFYANRDAWLLNGRVNNLEYGSYAPGAKNPFLNDRQFSERWRSSQRYYVLAEIKPAQRLQALVPGSPWRTVAASGGKLLLTNQ